MSTSSQGVAAVGDFLDVFADEPLRVSDFEREHAGPRVLAILAPPPAPLIIEAASFQIEFDRPVYNFDGSDLVILHHNTQHSGVAVSGSESSYVATVSGLSGYGCFTVSVHTLSDVADAEGRLMLDSVTSEQVFVDHGPAVEGEGEAEAFHSADWTRDYEIGLNELLRMIQLFNAGAYHCAIPAVSTDDGYALGFNVARQQCRPHSGDYAPQNWRINLTEMLRVVQFYNAGGLYACLEGEDGFCAGPNPSATPLVIPR